MSFEPIAKLLIGAGAMKSGTTWLFRVLASHPRICFTPEKELHYFFARRFDSTKISAAHRAKVAQSAIRKLLRADVAPEEYRRISDWYTSYISDPVDDAWYVRLFSGLEHGCYGADFSNLYSRLDAEGWQHLRNLTDRLKVIYVMRHPLERLWSHLKFHARLTRNRVNLASLDEVRMVAMAENKAISLNGEYTKAIMQMRESLQPDELLISFYEEVHDDPNGWLSRFSNFAGIEESGFDASALNHRYNASHGPKPPKFFGKLFAPLYARELEGLERIGLEPARWWKPPAEMTG